MTTTTRKDTRMTTTIIKLTITRNSDDVATTRWYDATSRQQSSTMKDVMAGAIPSAYAYYEDAEIGTVTITLEGVSVERAESLLGAPAGVFSSDALATALDKLATQETLEARKKIAAEKAAAKKAAAQSDDDEVPF
jgi:hypothetical protein